MVDKLILEALKEALDPDKYEELIKHLNLDKLYKLAQDASFTAGLKAVKHLGLGGVTYDNIYKFTCYNKEGDLKWQDEVHNIVVDTGLVHTLSVVLDAGSPITTWYLGLYDASPAPAFGTTMSPNPGGTEFTEYANATRPALVFGTASATAPGATLTATQLAFSINADAQTCGGAFITSDSTKGGTTGTLYGGAAFTGGNKGVDSGDTLNVDVTINASSS
jgi:hypothetical protein